MQKYLEKTPKKGHDKTKHNMSQLNEFFLHYLCFFFFCSIQIEKKPRESCRL